MTSLAELLALAERENAVLTITFNGTYRSVRWKKDRISRRRGWCGDT